MTPKNDTQCLANILTESKCDENANYFYFRYLNKFKNYYAIFSRILTPENIRIIEKKGERFSKISRLNIETVDKIGTVDYIETVDNFETVNNIETVDNIETVYNIETVENIATVDYIETVDKLRQSITSRLSRMSKILRTNTCHNVARFFHFAP